MIELLSPLLHHLPLICEFVEVWETTVERDPNLYSSLIENSHKMVVEMILTNIIVPL